MDDESEPAMQEAIFDTRSKPGSTPTARPMTMHEKFALDEGEVTLSYPAELSAESFKDLEDRLQIILRGAKRRVIAAKTDDEAAN